MTLLGPAAVTVHDDGKMVERGHDRTIPKTVEATN
jgi:hypothetical protein